jgi:16S rRNA (guanine527-N7)-methyltransferase
VPDLFETITRHVSISQETVGKLSLYHDLLLKWQSKINLIGPDTINNIWQRHFLDSLQLINHLDNLSDKMVDLGSGAGFPGMVLAMAGARDVHLIESDARKVVFLKEAARLTRTAVTIYHCRIEDRPIGEVKIILARACAQLDALLPLASFYFSHGTDCLFHKGKNYSKEIEDAKEKWRFEHTIFPSVTDTQGIILKLSYIERRKHDI